MVNQKLTATEIGFTHDDFAALLDKYDYHFSPGDIVAGTVFSIEPRGALIDIGAKQRLTFRFRKCRLTG